jgi:hypothetical protein
MLVDTSDAANSTAKTYRGTKNDGRQAPHLWAMRFTVNILTSCPTQISATMGIDEGPLRWNIPDVCTYPPEVLGLEVSPSNASVKLAWFHRRCPVRCNFALHTNNRV